MLALNGWLYTSSDLHLEPLTLFAFFIVAALIRWRGDSTTRNIYALIVSLFALVSLLPTLMTYLDNPAHGLIDIGSFLIPVAIILAILFLPGRKQRP